MSATPLVVTLPGQVTVELGSDAQKGITLKRGSQETVIHPPPEVIWTKMVMARSANSVYLLGYDEIGDDMYQWASLFRVALPGPTEPLTNCRVSQVLSYAAVTNALGDALIEDLEGASDDGRRFLLTLAFREPANSPSAAYIRRRP